MERNKILITVPAITARGGLTNYYQVLKNEFSLNVEYFERGARTWPIRKGFIKELIRAWQDYRLFKVRLRKNDIVLVQTSTSLGLYTTIRDGLFLRHARKNKINTIVFFRGWDPKEEKKVEKNLWLFKYFFFSNDCILTLTEHSKECIQKWGYKGDIYNETTVVDKNLIKNVSIESLKEKFKKIKHTNQINLLFLSRIERNKGIYELIDAYKKIIFINQEYNINLNICGDGFELQNIKRIVEQEKIQGITISGFVEGYQKLTSYENAHIFIFPSYNEGMPNAVLEAMGFGLPIITTKVGAINDFFENNINGFFIETANSSDIVEKLLKMIKSKDLMTTMSISNFEKANKIFRSDIVAKRIELIFSEVVKKHN